MKAFFNPKRTRRAQTMTAKPSAELKGSNFTLSVLKLLSPDPSSVQALLVQKRSQAPEFFKYAPLVLNIEALETLPDLRALQNIIHAQAFLLVGITGVRNTEQRQAIHQLGLPILSSFDKDITLYEDVPATPDIGSTTTIHQGHVRSGQQVYAPNGSLVILGMVGLGAEVIADDSIHIYGALRGRAIAGVKSENAGIFCSRLEPELISIAGIYQLSDSIPKQYWRQSVHARLNQDKITFQSIHK